MTPAAAALAGAAADALAACEAHLRAVVGDGLPQVAGPGADTLDAGGKRLRPLLVLCCAGRVADPTPELIRAASAVELVHMATLVHDDLLDGATMRLRPPSARPGWPRFATGGGPGLASQDQARAGCRRACRSRR